MPGLVGINVGGAYVVRPGVSTQIDASAMAPNRPGPLAVAGVVGPADGGIPGTVQEFRSYAEAASALRGGAILSHLRRIFTPSPDIPGAWLVRFTRIGAPTQAVSVAALAGIDYTARDYGRHTNGISIQVAANATYGWDVTVRKRGDAYSRAYTVGPAIEALSSATTPKLTFDHTLRRVTMTENAVAVSVLDYPTDFVTLINLISWIKGRAGWDAKIKTGGDPSMPLIYMDNPVAGLAITAGFVAVPANQGMLIWKVAGLDTQVTAALDTGTVYTVLSVVAETYLTTGSGTANDVFSNSDWTAGLGVLATADVQNLFLATSDATVQGLAYQHTLDSRTVTRKRYRIYFTGGAAAATSSAAIAAVPGFDGPCVYCWNGTYDYNPINGVPENLGGLGVAAQMAGMACGTFASEPLTNKALISTRLEFPNPTDTEIDNCLIAGVTPVALDPVTGRATIVQALTTWQGGSNASFRKLQGLRIQDEIHKGFQRILGRFIGYPLDLTTGMMIRGECAKFLDQSIRSGQNPGGFLTPGYANGSEIPAWTGLSVTGDGIDLWDISVEAHPVGETDYIRVSVKLTPVPIALT
jgi:hypothetical protein